MKALISALALGLVVAFSAPAFAATGNAYVGDMLSDKSAPKRQSKRLLRTRHPDITQGSTSISIV